VEEAALAAGADEARALQADDDDDDLGFAFDDAEDGAPVGGDAEGDWSGDDGPPAEH
jgi:hypothetical protein